MLEGRALECVRGDRTLFSALDFTLAPGELLRVAGENGSGKTSLLRIVCGLSPPAAGDVCWKGESIRRLREDYWKELVYVGHANALKDDLTAQENLRIGCAIAGLATEPQETLAALDAFGVRGCAALPVRVLSQGQRRRVGLAKLAVSGSRPLWVLDEPFTALDKAAVEHMQGLIGAHLASGGAVLLTTHQEVAITAASSRRLDLTG
jgi:heme exporter protein A